MVFLFFFPFHFSLSPLSISSPFLLLFPYSSSFLIPFSISFLFLDLLFLAIVFIHRDTGCSRLRKNHLAFWKNAILPGHTQCLGHCREQGNVAMIRIMEPWYPHLLSLSMVSYVNVRQKLKQCRDSYEFQLPTWKISRLCHNITISCIQTHQENKEWSGKTSGNRCWDFSD